MKALRLFVLTAMMATAFASLAVATSSATTLNLAAGYPISAEAEGTTTLHPPLGEISCEESKLEGKTTNQGGPTETVKGTIEALTFTNCNATVTVLKKGTLEIHTSGEGANNNGTLTSSGAEVTVSFGFHCIFSTNNTSIGTLTGGSPATLDIEAEIPRTGGTSGAFCGSSAEWTGAYEVTAPSTLNVDGTSGEIVAHDGGVGVPVFTAIVGKEYAIPWKNITANKLTINIENNSNAAVVETTGKPCVEIPAGGVCETKKFKCLKVGESTLDLRRQFEITGMLLVQCHKE